MVYFPRNSSTRSKQRGKRALCVRATEVLLYNSKDFVFINNIWKRQFMHHYLISFFVRSQVSLTHLRSINVCFVM